jgi:hypothetical protein
MTAITQKRFSEKLGVLQFEESEKEDGFTAEAQSLRRD